jgi:hypothetical protein
MELFITNGYSRDPHRKVNESGALGGTRTPQPSDPKSTTGRVIQPWRSSARVAALLVWVFSIVYAIGNLKFVNRRARKSWVS